MRVIELHNRWQKTLFNCSGISLVTVPGLLTNGTPANAPFQHETSTYDKHARLAICINYHHDILKE